jgi:eukaryotic-like serine/threonine-protein kinase
MSEPDPAEEVIFNAARQFTDPTKAAKYLDLACEGKPEMRERIQGLLQASAEADSFFGRHAAFAADILSPVVESAPAQPAGPPIEQPGQRIGRYKLLEKIGEGGMGVVYMAEQEEPVRRRVALKIIKLGMDTKQVVARFEAERQALALMDHPNIAKVLDGGATDTGRPYFVMELVQGVPITEFCDKNRLGAEERIKLFIQVCQAIQSAHQKGIIHRDIKPTNIMVTLNAGVPVPMVIDFGVAKAIQQKLTEKTVFTNFATMIGTPAYMSPEQAEMSRLDVDTRSDIYGLGVLLYELLTGTTPFPEKRLRSATYQEMQRIILEEEPERPSTRLRQTKTLSKSPAQSSILHSQLSTDLDWIVMKCLEKDRARRYETANGLAADLNRHLDNEPVVARPPTVSYRLQKAFRRNKLVFAAGAMVALALLVGMALAAWQAVRASRERDAKELALRQAVATQQEQTRLREEAQTAERDEARLREQAQAEAYASDTLLAQQAIEANNFGHARELLYRHRPQSKSDKDLRGWEWRYLWRQCTSDALAKVRQATSKITDLAVSPDGRWLAVGQNSDRAAVSILEFVDKTTARLVTNIPPQRGTDVSVAFSPKEPLLAFNSSQNTATNVQGTIHLWNLETQQSLFEFPIRSFCGSLAFSPDGSTLLVAVMNHYESLDGELLLVRVRDGTLMKRYDVSFPQGTGFAVDPAFHVAAVGGETLRLIDLSTGKQRWGATNEQGAFSKAVKLNEVDAAQVGCFAFAKEGRILITSEGLNDPLLRVWEASTGSPMGQALPLHHGMVNSFVSWPDGKTLASANADGTIQMWDVSNPSEVHSLGRPLQGEIGSIHALALRGDGQTLLSGSWDGSIYVWDTTSLGPDRSPLVLTNIFDFQFTSNRRSLLTIDLQGRVWRREGTNLQAETPLFDIGADLVPVRDHAEFSGDGELLATAQGGMVRVWDLRTGSKTPRLATPGMLVAHSFAPDGKLFIVYDRGNASVDEWDLATFQKLRSSPRALPFREIPLLALSSNGKYLLNVSSDGDEALVREVATGKEATWLDLGAGNVWDANFSPDGALFAVASMRGSAQIWEGGSRELVAKVGHEQLPVFGVSFSPDGSRLLTASDGPEALTLWDFRSRRELVHLPAPGFRFDSPRFSADGWLVGCRNWQNELYIWRAPSWAEIEAAEKTVPDSQSSNIQKGNL